MKRWAIAAGVVLAACGPKTAAKDPENLGSGTGEQVSDPVDEPDPEPPKVKTYDFSEDLLTGDVLVPNFPVADADATPYAKAWHLVVTGDLVGAQAGLAEVVGVATTPVKKTKSKPKATYPALPDLRNEYVTLTALTGVDHVTAGAAWSKAKDGAVWLQALADAYFVWGELARCDAALTDLQPLVAKDKAKLAWIEETRARIRLTNEDVAGTADAYLAAWDAAKDLPDADTRDELAGEIGDIAKMFHSEYADTLLPGFADAAARLYAVYLAIPDREDEAEMKTYSDELASAVASQGANVEGTLKKDDIRRRVRRHLGEVLACYVRPLQADHALAGTLSLAFRIGADGIPRAIEATGFDAAGSCVAEHVARWRFAPTPGEIVVAYPFQFSTAPG